MFDFRYFKKIDMHSHIGTWGNPFNFSGDINLILELMEKFNIEKTILCPSDSSKNKDIVEAYKNIRTSVAYLLSSEEKSSFTISFYIKFSKPYYLYSRY